MLYKDTFIIFQAMSLIGTIINKWPGRRFGLYRFLPIFFVLGGLLEYSMINWTVGETNFCKLSLTRIDWLS